MGEEDYTLVNVYALNVNQGEFYKTVIKGMEKVRRICDYGRRF